MAGKLNFIINFFKIMNSNYFSPLIVATVVSPPFMIVETLPEGEIYTDGLDGVLLRVLSQKMNFGINCTIVDSQGVIMSNGTVTGK